jgi:hypothetical protein
MTDSYDAPYPIIEIQPAWVLEGEAMGSKPKFWFRQAEEAPEWLFKYPQENTGQHWAEKIATEVASLLDILHARVELAVFQGVRGSATESFAREGRELFQALPGFWWEGSGLCLAEAEPVKAARSAPEGLGLDGRASADTLEVVGSIDLKRDILPCHAASGRWVWEGEHPPNRIERRLRPPRNCAIDPESPTTNPEYPLRLFRNLSGWKCSVRQRGVVKAARSAPAGLGLDSEYWRLSWKGPEGSRKRSAPRPAQRRAFRRRKGGRETAGFPTGRRRGPARTRRCSQICQRAFARNSAH